jgi:hypothetical protein
LAETCLVHNAAKAIIAVLIGAPPPWLIIVELRSLLFHAEGFLCSAHEMNLSDSERLFASHNIGCIITSKCRGKPADLQV